MNVQASIQGDPYPDDNPKTQFGVKKPQLHAIPASSLLLLGQVMQLGEAKYGLTNWRHKTVSSSVYYDAAMRHLLSWLDGESTDPESGVSHLAHVMACCAILLDAEATGNLNDDRPLIGAAPRLILQLTAEG